MERLEQAIYHNVEMYEGYAKSDGKLHPKELGNIIEKEIQNPELKAKLGVVDFDKAMKRMDKNSDGDIDYTCADRHDSYDTARRRFLTALRGTLSHWSHLQLDVMSSIFEAIVTLRGVFDKYAGKEGNATTLTKKELAELLKDQLGEASGNQAEMDEFFKSLDNDRDGTVDFNEYIVLVASLAMMLAP